MFQAAIVFPPTPGTTIPPTTEVIRDVTEFFDDGDYTVFKRADGSEERYIRRNLRKITLSGHEPQDTA